MNIKIHYILFCACLVLLLSCTKKEKENSEAKGFFNLQSPSQVLKLDENLKFYYMWGYEVGRNKVFQHVSVDMLEERIREQKANKSAFFDYGFVASSCGSIDKATKEQNGAWSDGYFDGMEFANKLIAEAINKYYDDPSIIDDYKKLKKKIKEETSNKSVSH